MIRVAALLRRIARRLCRRRRPPIPSRTLSESETDAFRRQMRDHGMDDYTPDPSSKREDMQ
jgi:hypothetical protein